MVPKMVLPLGGGGVDRGESWTGEPPSRRKLSPDNFIQLGHYETSQEGVPSEYHFQPQWGGDRIFSPPQREGGGGGYYKSLVTTYESLDKFRGKTVSLVRPPR